MTLSTFEEYVDDGARRMLSGRRSDQWVTSIKERKGANSDLWMEFDRLAQIHHVGVRWITFRSKDRAASACLATAWRAARGQHSRLPDERKG